MIKEILLDADGMIIKKGKYKYFSERFSAEHGVPLEKIVPFFGVNMANVPLAMQT